MNQILRMIGRQFDRTWYEDLTDAERNIVRILIKAKVLKVTTVDYQDFIQLCR